MVQGRKLFGKQFVLVVMDRGFPLDCDLVVCVTGVIIVLV